MPAASELTYPLHRCRYVAGTPVVDLEPACVFEEVDRVRNSQCSNEQFRSVYPGCERFGTQWVFPDYVQLEDVLFFIKRGPKSDLQKRYDALTDSERQAIQPDIEAAERAFAEAGAR